MASYYWVGGNGTWDTSSTAHWATTSGGTGGAGVPTLYDDVFFDANSVGTITISGNVYSHDLTIGDTSGIIFTATNDVLIITYGDVSNSISNTISGAALYANSYITLVLASTSGIQSYEQYSIYPFYRVNAIGAYNITSYLGASQYPIKEINVSTGLCQLEPSVSAVSIAISGTGIIVVSSGAVIVYKSLSIGGTGTAVGMFYLDQEQAISGLSYLTVDISTSNTNGYILHVKKGEVRFSGSGRSRFSLEVDPLGTATTSLVFSTSNALSISSISINGNATRSVAVKSSVSGTRAKFNYTGVQTSPTYVTVKDIHVVTDDKIISYSANSSNLGNNWQWYFDSFKKPIRNLFFGSHV